MLKPASSRCNLRCSYCFYADETNCREIGDFGLMPIEKGKTIIRNVLSEIDCNGRLDIAFQGGEPTIVGLEWFKEFTHFAIEEAKKKNIATNFALQTNGILIDEEWCKFLSENEYLVGLSIDGPKEIHDIHRLHINGTGSYDDVLKTKKLLDSYDVPYNILMTVTNELALHPDSVWNYIVEEDIRYVQFIACLGPLNEDAPYALIPENYASFYSYIFDKWACELRKGNYYSIKLLDDIFNSLLHGKCNTCGFDGKCMNQVIIESDGSVYPCDFYVLDEFKLGTLPEDNYKAITSRENRQKFLDYNKEISNLCADCYFKRICGGGCKRMRKDIFGVGNGACGFRMFLSARKREFEELAMFLQQ